MIENAKRLADDANILRKNGSYPSAFLLATLAVEEIGRVILAQWERRGPLPKASRHITYHIRKQAAVAFLLGVPEGNAIFDDLIGEGKINEGNARDFCNQLIKGIDTSWFISAGLGDVELDKQNCTYVDLKDGSGVNIPDATNEMVFEAIQRVARAYLILRGKLGQPQDLWQARRLYQDWLMSDQPLKLLQSRAKAGE